MRSKLIYLAILIGVFCAILTLDGNAHENPVLTPKQDNLHKGLTKSEEEELDGILGLNLTDTQRKAIDIWYKLIQSAPIEASQIDKVVTVIDSDLPLSERIELIHRVGDFGTPELKKLVAQKMQNPADPHGAKILEVFNAGKKQDSLYIAIGQGKWDDVKAAVGEVATAEFLSLHKTVLDGIKEATITATTSQDQRRFADLHNIEFIVNSSEKHGHDPLPKDFVVGVKPKAGAKP